jgi:diguanylate cyclase
MYFFNKVEKMIIKELFTNIAILISILFLYTQVSNGTPLHSRSSIKRKVLVGILGGLLSNLLMQYSMHIDSKSIIDLRHVPIILLAYFGGAIPSLIAMPMVILGRLLIGFNTSAFASIAVIILITIFSIYLSRTQLSKNVKIFFMLTFSNIAYSVIFVLLIQNYSLLISLILIYWIISYLSGYVSFYTLDFLRSSQMLFNKFKTESSIDGLTGLNNVRKFDEIFNRLITDLKTNHQDLSLLYIDIDFFKKVNDTYGHLEGDLVLKELGIILRKCTRSFDVVSRNGGEEFTVLLLDCHLKRAVEIAERIRTTVEESYFTLNNGKKIKLTISIGVASYKNSANDDPAMLIDDADKALYQAKNSGRNKVYAAN